MRAAQNERLTRVGPGTPGGTLHRHYWQPIALVDEFDPTLDPRMRDRPVKRVRVLGEDLVLFRAAAGRPGEPSRWGLLERPCPHRGADLAFARYEAATEGSAEFALRCPFHGWKFAADGRCLETPAEPADSRLCQSVRQKSYPAVERAGVVYAFLGDGPPPPAPDLPCHRAPASHSFAFKGLWRCNWLQAFEVGIDPAHPSYLHRYFRDESTEGQFGRQFRGASAGEVDGERWPMTRVLRERAQPEIAFTPTDWGVEITTLRPIDAARIEHRLPEPLANPWLVLAALAAAGLDGVERSLMPPPPCESPYAEGALITQEAADALADFRASPFIERTFGPIFVEAWSALVTSALRRHAEAVDRADGEEARRAASRNWQRREYLL